VIIDTEFNSAAQVPTKICVEATQLAETEGFGCVWKGESNSRDPLVLLSAYAAVTKRIEIGTAIYHMFGRSPVTMGIQAATLNEYADGRFILGLGVANPTIAAWHGDVYEKPLRRIREYIEIVRAVYAGERVEYEGECYASSGGFKLAFEPPRRSRCESGSPLSGRRWPGSRDGSPTVSSSNMANPARVAEIAGWCREGAEGAGKDPSGLQVVPKLRVALHEDVNVAKKTLSTPGPLPGHGEHTDQVLAEVGYSESEISGLRAKGIV
jgi:alkanesulfonate monooxygenase SsuD/methylene tetrahydromethanopterin reductase-like flavin-dependent oxidoreductase (luciferase family)